MSDTKSAANSPCKGERPEVWQLCRSGRVSWADMYPLASLTSLQSLNLGGPSDTSGRLVLMEKGRRRKDPLLDRAEGRFALCFRRPLEKLEGTGHRGVVTHLTIITGEPNEL